MQLKVGLSTIELVMGDITKQKVDAIVNAANTKLLPGGGVDGAIRKAGGDIISKECAEIIQKQGGCPTGKAVFTSAGRLPARYVIHAVGPIWKGGTQKEEELLASAYRESLTLAKKLDVKSIAFPSISTGIYKYPLRDAAYIALKTVKEFLEKEQDISMHVYFVLFDKETFDTYQKVLGIFQ
jgi:O-acetyl-ADP-ribose deacetylase (regulator of RNase III)